MRGMADAGREVVGPMVIRAWDDFLELVDTTDLSEPSRLPGWRAHEVCVHLGTWPERDALADVLASARGAARSTHRDSDEVNAVLTRAHQHDSSAEVRASLQTARDNAAAFFASADPMLDLAPASSVVGPLPVLSVLLAGTYELAVHALDLAPAGAPRPSEALLLTGLAALAEVTGALAASLGVHGRTALHTSSGGWAFASRPGVDGAPGEWDVERLGAGPVVGTAVEAPAATLLDLSAGRINPVAAIARGHLRVHDLRGLLRLTPIVESVPNLPGGPALRVAARTLSGVSGLTRLRLPR